MSGRVYSHRFEVHGPVDCTYRQDAVRLLGNFECNIVQVESRSTTFIKLGNKKIGGYKELVAYLQTQKDATDNSGTTLTMSQIDDSMYEDTAQDASTLQFLESNSVSVSGTDPTVENRSS